MTRRVSSRRLFAAACLAVGSAFAGLRGSNIDGSIARLEIRTVRSDTGKIAPSRIYLFKDGEPFRLSPIDVMLPLRVDRFYRERLWRPASGASERPKTLEVANDGESHFILLEGSAGYDLPAGKYRVEAYRGTSWKPDFAEFALSAGESRTVSLTLRPVRAESGRIDGSEWIASDDHIHLPRDREDDSVFLAWLEADDLAVGNFLQLQRQIDAAPQYAFGPEGEARRSGFSIRSGQESRSEFYGHVNMLGPKQLIRPLSIGTMYANTPEAYPYPNLLFKKGRSLGALVGYAHFDGSMPHSTLPLDLALDGVDFIEVFQFGILKAEPWHELLNAGFRVNGIAGSDFPANLSKYKPWTRAIPLLGPERTLVKLDGPIGDRSAYEVWAEKVRRGEATVSNGPLLDFRADSAPPGSTRHWTGAETTVRVEAIAAFHRPIEAIEIIVNGRVAELKPGDGRSESLALESKVTLKESSWIAARVRAKRLNGEPDIQAHTNPVYVLRDRRPVYVKSARDAVADRWEEQMRYYRSSALVFETPDQRRELERKLDETLKILRSEPTRIP